MKPIDLEEAEKRGELAMPREKAWFVSTQTFGDEKLPSYARHSDYTFYEEPQWPVAAHPKPVQPGSATHSI